MTITEFDKYFWYALIFGILVLIYIFTVVTR